MLRSILMSALIALASLAEARADDLPSWTDGPVKQAVVEFVTAATTEGSPGWIAPTDRIATFDNDGTLWAEKPMYFQAMFVMDRVRALAPEHPDWATTQPFKAVLEGDMHALAEAGQKGLMELVAATHSGMTADEFEAIVKDWIATARHPTLDRPYTSAIYAPMVELLAYLRANGFETWIVSGGGIDFMRPWVEGAYGIPPQQVIGSQIAESYQVIDGKPQMVRESGIFFVDDGPGKPVGIHRHIGKRPVLAVGNSDGDYQMLEYVTAADGPRLGLILHHTDAAREFAYDRESHIGKLDKALTDAPEKGWVVIDMARDWKTVFPPAP